jgi:hypothetical protein
VSVGGVAEDAKQLRHLKPTPFVGLRLGRSTFADPRQTCDHGGTNDPSNGVALADNHLDMLFIYHTVVDVISSYPALFV